APQHPALADRERGLEERDAAQVAYQRLEAALARRIDEAEAVPRGVGGVVPGGPEGDAGELEAPGDAREQLADLAREAGPGHLLAGELRPVGREVRARVAQAEPVHVEHPRVGDLLALEHALDEQVLLLPVAAVEAHPVAAAGRGRERHPEAAVAEAGDEVE